MGAKECEAPTERGEGFITASLTLPRLKPQAD